MRTFGFQGGLILGLVLAFSTEASGHRQVWSKDVQVDASVPGVFEVLIHLKAGNHHGTWARGMFDRNRDGRLSAEETALLEEQLKTRALSGLGFRCKPACRFEPLKAKLQTKRHLALLVYRKVQAETLDVRVESGDPVRFSVRNPGGLDRHGRAVPAVLAPRDQEPSAWVELGQPPVAPSKPSL